MTLAEAKAYLEERHIDLILAQFVDVHGVPKAKAVPSEHLKMILEDGAGFAGFALWGYGMGPDGADLMYRGDLSTLTAIDWLPGYARIACNGYVNDAPYEYDTRGLLVRLVDEVFAERGMQVFAGLEPEFYLLNQDEITGELEPAVPGDALEKPCYDYQGLSGVADFLRKLTLQVRAAGLDVYQIDHEDANAQYEVNFTFADAVKTADSYVLFKMAASTLAKEAGLIASFMPKPFANKTGNGMHLHLSMGLPGAGNAFAAADDDRGLGLSPLAYQFLAGVLDHAASLAAVACPTVNSYKRLFAKVTDSGATWAPVLIAYGDNNRTAAIRVCGGHIEVRFPDSAANPYLLIAAVVAAGMDGVRRQLDPGDPTNRNLYTMTADEAAAAGLQKLPANLGAALDALEADTVIMEALGTALMTEFVRIKRLELKAFETHVTDWERDSYLTFY